MANSTLECQGGMNPIFKEGGGEAFINLNDYIHYKNSISVVRLIVKGR